MAHPDLTDLVQAYADSTARFLQAASSVSATDLDRRPADGWSARMIVHHLADAETVAYTRLCRLLADPPVAVIQGFDEQAWADCPQLGYQELPIEASLTRFAAVRAGSLHLLHRLTPADLDRAGEHTQAGRVTVGDWIAGHTGHARTHADQLEQAAHGPA